MRSLVLLCSLPVAVLSGAACGRGPPIVLGYAYARASPDAADVAQEALDHLARQGGPAMRILRWVPDASAGLPKEVQGATRFASTEGLVAVVGHAGSRESLLGAPVYNRAGIPQIVPTSTSRRLADAGPWTFRLAPNDSIEGDVIAGFVSDSLRARSATIFYYADEYGAGLRDGVRAGLERRGAAVIDEVSVHDGSCPPLSPHDDFATVVAASLHRLRPDAVVLAGRRRDGSCVMRLVDSAHPGTPFVAGDGSEATAPEFRRVAGSAMDRLHAVVFWLPAEGDSASRDFAERFRRIVGRDPNDTDAMIYDAFLLLGQAVREVGPDRERVRRWLESLGDSRPAWTGVTGPISFRGERRDVINLIRPSELPNDLW